jgi:hypothetical protein
MQFDNIEGICSMVTLSAFLDGSVTAAGLKSVLIDYFVETVCDEGTEDEYTESPRFEGYEDIHYIMAATNPNQKAGITALKAVGFVKIDGYKGNAGSVTVWGLNLDEFKASLKPKPAPKKKYKLK